jgi:CHASE2 domain-containing sensor protein/signal transduction histidine kinase
MNRRFLWQLLPGVMTGFVFLLMWQGRMLLPLEQVLYRGLFQLRGEQNWDDRLVLVAIDDGSLQRLGRYPWPRARFTQLVERLAVAEPSVVAMDVIFSEPGDGDGALAEAIDRQGRVILGSSTDPNDLPLLPVPALREAALVLGHLDTDTEGDGIIRSVRLQIKGEPVLGLAAVRANGLTQTPTELPDLNQPLGVNWVSRMARLPKYSFADVVEGKVPEEAFRNKIVLVGMTAKGFDRLLTPFDPTVPTTGIMVHATVVNNLLTGRQLLRLHSDWLMGAWILAAPLWSWVLGRQRTGRQLLLGGLLILGWGALVVVMFGRGVWLPMGLPVGVLAGTVGSVVAAERLRVNRLLETQVGQLWAKYGLPGKELEPGRSPIADPQANRVAWQLSQLAEQFGRSQATQQAVTENLRLGVVAFDRQLQVWFCNPQAVKCLGIGQGERLGLGDDWWMGLWAGEPCLWEVGRGDIWYQFSIEVLPAVNLASFEPVADSYLLTIEDITARKQMEANLEKQIGELQWLDRVKDEFLGGISHDLRSPLTNIKVAIQLLKRNGIPSQERYLKILETECQREEDLVQDLLDVQNLSGVSKPLPLHELDLSDWIKEFVAPFQARAHRRQQNISLDLPEHRVLVDTEKRTLARIVGELLTNACKYTPENGLIKVKIRQMDGETTIAVSNHGTEISVENLDRIFEKFYRIPLSDPWQQGGTGLGLALVERLVERLGGRIGVVSGEMVTTFTVVLEGANLHHH